MNIQKIQVKKAVAIAAVVVAAFALGWCSQARADDAAGANVAYVAMVPMAWIADKVFLYGKAGFHRYKADYKPSGEVSGGGALLGFGVEMELAKHARLRAEAVVFDAPNVGGNHANDRSHRIWSLAAVVPF